jgi:predicted HicB family RNase H-like nuclease
MKEEKKFIAIRLDAELHYQIKMQALKERKSMQIWIEEVLTAKMDQINDQKLNGY